MKTWKKPVLQRVSNMQISELIKASACSAFFCHGHFR